MTIEKASGSDPLLVRPSATTDRPSGQAQATQKISSEEVRETDRRANQDEARGTKINVLA